METQTRNAIIGAGVGAGVGAAAGVGAGLAANKLIKPSSDAQFVSVAQANKIRAQIKKDVFGFEPDEAKVSFVDRIKNLFKADNGKFDLIERAKSAHKDLESLKGSAEGASEEGLENIAKHWNLDMKKVKDPAQGLIDQLGGKIKEAGENFTKSLAKCRKHNLIAVGAVVVGAIAAIAGGIAGNAISKKD